MNREREDKLVINERSEELYGSQGVSGNIMEKEKERIYDNDYDNVFKSMKYNNKELFIPVINEIFGKNYTRNDKITLLSSEGDITKIEYGKADIESRTSDFLMKIKDDIYLIEEQSYQDGSMAIRIAEYTFIVAKENAEWRNGRVFLKMPNYCVIYVKSTKSTPKYTRITYEFPDGQVIHYDSKNIIIKNYTKEEILQKRLYPYIPYYILRYEKNIKKNKISIDVVEEEMIYLLKGLKNALDNGYIDERDYVNIKAFTNTVIEHFMAGEQKERLVSVMGGKIIYTEADKIYYKAIKEGREKGIEEGIEEGRIEIIFEMIQEGDLSKEKAAKKLGITMDELEKKITERKNIKTENI